MSGHDEASHLDAAGMSIRNAAPEERAALEDLQRRASMDGPRYRRELEAHPDAIALPIEQITSGLVRVAERNGRLVGFAALLQPVDGICELDGLFVDPPEMRTGVGRALVEDSRHIALARGAVRIGVVANPQAHAFYEAVGFAVTGESETRFGRAPRMELAVSAVSSPKT